MRVFQRARSIQHVIWLRLQLEITIDARVISLVRERHHELKEPRPRVAQPCVGLDERGASRVMTIVLPARRLVAPDRADRPAGDALRSISRADQDLTRLL